MSRSKSKLQNKKESVCEVKAYPFSNTCRLCLSYQTNLVKIFNKKFPDLPMNIYYCFQIRVFQNDRLPKGICESCNDQILKFVTFKQICLQADEILRESIDSDIQNTDYSNVHFANENQIKKSDSESDNNDNDSSPDDFFDKDDNRNDNDYKNEMDSFEKVNNGNRRGRPPGRKNANQHGDTLKRVKKIRMTDESFVYDFDPDSIESYLISLERQDEIKEAAKCNYICNICFATSKTMLDYLDHQEMHEGKPVFHCDRCEKVFTKKIDCKNHENTHKVPCPECNKLVRPPSLKTHLVSHTDKFKCKICNTCVGNKKQLESHQFLIHNDIREHICESCGKCFKTKSALKTHTKSHSEERPYQCKLCVYAGRTASGLYTHMTQHLRKQLVCNVCQKIFTSSKRLNDHKWRVHNTDKKYECAFCQEQFTQKSKMALHLRVHVDEKQFACKKCNRTFGRSDLLKAHEKIKCEGMTLDNSIMGQQKESNHLLDNNQLDKNQQNEQTNYNKPNNEQQQHHHQAQLPQSSIIPTQNHILNTSITTNSMLLNKPMNIIQNITNNVPSTNHIRQYTEHSNNINLQQMTNMQTHSVISLLQQHPSTQNMNEHHHQITAPTYFKSKETIDNFLSVFEKQL